MGWWSYVGTGDGCGCQRQFSVASAVAVVCSGCGWWCSGGLEHFGGRAWHRFLLNERVTASSEAAQFSCMNFRPSLLLSIPTVPLAFFSDCVELYYGAKYCNELNSESLLVFAV